MKNKPKLSKEFLVKHTILTFSLKKEKGVFNRANVQRKSKSVQGREGAREPLTQCKSFGLCGFGILLIHSQQRFSSETDSLIRR